MAGASPADSKGLYMYIFLIQHVKDEVRICIVCGMANSSHREGSELKRQGGKKNKAPSASGELVAGCVVTTK